jgi:hypothetical protein
VDGPPALERVVISGFPIDDFGVDIPHYRVEFLKCFSASLCGGSGWRGMAREDLYHAFPSILALQKSKKPYR